MQVKDYYLISKKQYIDEELAIRNFEYDLNKWFSNILDIVLATVKNSNGNIPYLYQVEAIFGNHLEEYQEILSNNIQEHYINVSENKEALINNKVAQKHLETVLLYNTANKKDYQSSLDDFLDYNYNLDDEQLKQMIKDKLRYNNNVQTSLNKYLNNNPSNNELIMDVALTDLLTYEIDQAIIEYMSNEVFVASERTMNRVTQEVYDIIKESYANRGEGIDVVTQDIQNKFTNLRKFEAQRIARTETLKAQGHATYKRLVNNPNVLYYQWISTHDKRTRPSHRLIDGEITYADGSGVFSNGLRFPGDTNGAIEEWINCRCDLVAYVPEVGYVAPAGAAYWKESDFVFDPSIQVPEVNIEMEEYLASYW